MKALSVRLFQASVILALTLPLAACDVSTVTDFFAGLFG